MTKTQQQKYNRRYWKQNKDRITEHRRTQKKKIQAYQRMYRKKHLAHLKAYAAQWRKHRHK